MALHSKLGPVDGIHPVHTYVFATSVTRGTLTDVDKGVLTLTAVDIGKVAFQQSDETFWILSSISPVDWAEVGAATATPGAHSPTHEHGEVDALAHDDLFASAPTNSHTAIDTHIAASTTHFTEGSINHTAIANIGTNSHAAIDTHVTAAAAHIANTSNPHSVTHTQAGAAAAAHVHAVASDSAAGFRPVSKMDATTAPGAGDDTGDGFEVGSLWIDVTANKTYSCVDSTSTAAVWNDLTAGGGGGGGHSAAVDPTASDDSYSLGTVWVNTVTDRHFICVDASSSAAIWASLSTDLNAIVCDNGLVIVDDGNVIID
tara:strand:- start:854 stop:1801 length:948 start_codon:yes stop_codon:yes gene_type:complete